ncbi:glycosyltransferase [Jiella sonneratiae]|uniref:Glycosyltransferase n=1 Tax=Jiella sonneratiae TaxID=2816856 RepID=A0ABS3J5U5_9HYPH|nr:glycosyltransferase [Jiella sonneratiae]MBO0905056.1 glycosyltransferase [Jiella sonneratiae]
MSKGSSSSFDRLLRPFAARGDGAGERPVRSEWAALSKTTTFLTGARPLIKAGDRANAEHRWNDAEKSYGEALRRNPKLEAVWVQYGHALKEQGFASRAEEAYRQALNLRPDKADTHLQLGHALKLQGKRSEAIAAYREAYMRDPASPHAAEELRGLAAPVPTGEEISGHLGEPNGMAGAGGPAGSAAASAAVFRRAPEGPLEQFLAANDLSLALLGKFDAEFYYYSTPSLRSRQQSFDREAALKHFVATGIGDLAAIREGYDFEPDFYVETYAQEVRSSDPSEVYRHYLRNGIEASRWPNRRLWLEALLGPTVRGLPAIELPSFAGADASQSFVDRFSMLMNEIMATQGSEVAIEARHAPLLVLIADRFVLEGKDDQALVAYQKILAAAPDFAPALRHFADCLLRRKCYLEASAIYERLTATADTTIWAYINLSHCAEQLGDQLAALRWLKAAIERFPADIGLRRRFHDLAPRFLTSSWLLANSQAAGGRLSDAQARVESDCDTVHGLLHTDDVAEKRYVRSVALVGNFDLPQCRFYRIDQKIEQLEAAGFVVESFNFKDGIQRFLEKVHCFDAVIFFRVPAYYDVIRAIDKAREVGCATFYEIDDLIFDAQFFPPAFETYDNQISRKEHEGLALGVPLFRAALRYSENALVSTKPLVGHVERAAPGTPAFVHANALHSPHAQHIGHQAMAPSSGRVTIFYGSGTKAHKQDFQELVEPALVAMAKKYRDRVSIVLAGYMSPGSALRECRDSLVLLPPVWDVHQYWATLSAADINLAVLKPAPTTDVKSEIKWLEAAMLGIPSVISETALYADLIEDGVDGLLARTPGEWTEALDRLIGDAELRARIGRNAREKALQQYGVPAMAKNITGILRQAALPAPDERKRVLVVNVFYPPQSLGGATRVVHDNVKHFAAHHRGEFSFDVFSSIEGGTEPYKVSSHAADGVRVVGVTTPSIPDIDRIVYDEKMAKVFGDYLDVCRPDIIHFHCIQRLTTAIILETRRRGIPYVLTVHDGWWISDEQFLLGKDDRIDLYDHGNPASQLGRVPAEQFATRMQLRECLLGAEKVLAVSNAFAEVYRSTGIPNVVAVPNGGSEIVPLPRIPSPDGKVRLGFIGGLARHKGYHLIQRALLSGGFENLRFVFIDHAMAVGTRRQSRLGTTEVDIRPKISQSRVAELYAELDVLVAPSVWPEAYGLVTREAQMCGCWVIASDRGAVGEDIVEGENGFRVDVSSPEGLVEVLRKIDRDPARYLQSPAVQAGIRRAADQAEDLVAIYREILLQRGSSPEAALERAVKSQPEPASQIASAEANRLRDAVSDGS